MVYIKTFVDVTEKPIVPIYKDNNVNVIMPCDFHKQCGLYDIFGDCKELKEKEYLNVTKIKDNLNPMLTSKGKADFDVSFNIRYLFIPYTKFIYTTICIEFNNGDLVKEIFDDGLFESKYREYFYNYSIKMINNDYRLKDEIKIDNSNFYISKGVSIKTGDWSNSRFSDTISDYKYDGFVSIMHWPIVVAKQNILNELIRKVKNGMELLKINAKADFNGLLLELKKEYIDFLNIDCEWFPTSYNGRKSENYLVLHKLLNIDSLNEEYLNLLKNYEDLVKTVVDQKNIALSDTLNTIQISSVVLTVVGWILVIMQHDLPSRVPTYIISILLCSLVSVTIAIVIKKIIDRR